VRGAAQVTLQRYLVRLARGTASMGFQARASSSFVSATAAAANSC
jgi:hypothetical protein